MTRELLKHVAARLGYREKYALQAAAIMSMEDGERPESTLARREYEILVAAGYLQNPLLPRDL